MARRGLDRRDHEHEEPSGTGTGTGTCTGKNLIPGHALRVGKVEPLDWLLSRRQALDPWAPRPLLLGPLAPRPLSTRVNGRTPRPRALARSTLLDKRTALPILHL